MSNESGERNKSESLGGFIGKCGISKVLNSSDERSIWRSRAALFGWSGWTGKGLAFCFLLRDWGLYISFLLFNFFSLLGLQHDQIRITIYFMM